MKSSLSKHGHGCLLRARQMHMAAPRFSTNVVTSATWAAPDASPTSQTTRARPFTRLSIYKGKAAMQLSIIPPTWSSVPGDKGMQVTREGVILFEFANVAQGSGQQTGYGDRSYDWDNKLTFAMKAIEACNLLDAKKINESQGFSLIHDPSIGTKDQGQVTKTFGAKPNADGNSWAFTLNQNSTGTKSNCFVPVTSAELIAIQSVVSFAVPRLMGFDVVLTAPIFL